MKNLHSICLTLAVIAVSSSAAAQEERPPLMGWSSWNTYGLDINEDLIKEQADAMVSTGLKDAGYNYINIDDGFWDGRNEDGSLRIDTQKFPNGMRTVADYIHSKGLKAGIYSDAGDNTCGSGNTNPYGLGVGFFRHEAEDCKTYFVDWDYDFIKVDYCGGMHLNLDDKVQYTKIADAIKNCGKDDIRFNICRWAYPGTWVSDIAESWRTTGDIYAAWESVRNILSENLYLSAYCKNGRYNDMDMLEVGRGMTADEDLTHFAMWCMLNSPLLVGCDMRNMSPETVALLTNEELIALNQDPLHLQAYVAYKSGSVYVLVKDLETKYGPKRAIALYNPSDRAATVTLNFSQVELDGNVALRDLAEHTDLGQFTDKYRVTVPAHGVKVFEAVADNRLERKRYEAECGYIGAYQELINNEIARTGIYSYDDNCSGGMKVGWLGYKDNNDLTFNNVYSKTGGIYDLTIAYLSGEDRYIKIDVNGTPAGYFNANSGSYDKVGTQTVRIKLNPGENTIRLYDTDYFMPDIDYFDITPVDIEQKNVTVVSDDTAVTPQYYNLSGAKILNPESGKIYVEKTGEKAKKVVL